MLKDVKIHKKSVNSVIRLSKGVYISSVSIIVEDDLALLHDLLPPFGKILPSGYIDSPKLFLSAIAPIVESEKGNYVCKLYKIKREEESEDPVQLCVYHGGYFGDKKLENTQEKDECGFGYAGELWLDNCSDYVYSYNIYKICDLGIKQKYVEIKYFLVVSIVNFLYRVIRFLQQVNMKGQ